MKQQLEPRYFSVGHRYVPAGGLANMSNVSALANISFLRESLAQSESKIRKEKNGEILRIKLTLAQIQIPTYYSSETLEKNA